MDERRRELAQFLGIQVKTRREARDWSQEKLAREIEMSRETVRAIEKGDSLPDVPTIERLAMALQCGVGDLLPSLAERATLDQPGRQKQPQAA